MDDDLKLRLERLAAWLSINVDNMDAEIADCHEAISTIERLERELTEFRAMPTMVESSDGPPGEVTGLDAIRMLAEARTSEDRAYSERDSLVSLVSKRFPSWLERHPESDTEWEDDWRWIVIVELPTGQCSWHIHDSELPWFGHLERRDGNSWDGHTADEKYERVALLTPAEARNEHEWSVVVQSLVERIFSDVDLDGRPLHEEVTVYSDAGDIRRLLSSVRKLRAARAEAQTP